MLKHKLKFLLVSLFMISVSCQKDNLDESAQELPANAEQTLNYLTKTLGYNESDIELNLESQEFYVEGDMGVSFDYAQNIEKFNQSDDGDGVTAKNQWMNIRTSYSNTRSIFYYMESNFPQN